MGDLADFYRNTALNAPKRHFLTRFVRDLKEDSLNEIDFCHYTVPLNTSNNNGFVFPGEYMGQYGVYDAVKHVYSNNASLKHLVHNDYLLTNQRYFAAEMERGVESLRANFRTENNIDPNAYVIFLSPGNERSEAEFSMETYRRGVKEFLLKYSAPTSLSPKALPLDGNFVTVISTQAGSEGEAYVNEFLGEKEWTGRLVRVTDKGNQHFDAMAASDFGFLYDGMLVSSANTLHLPVNCLIKMRMHQQWFHDLYNRWWNDMNIIADNSVNPELIGGQAWFGKICDTLAEAYVKPDTRYEHIQKLDGFV